VFGRERKKKKRRRTPRFLRPVLRPMAFRVLPRALRPGRVGRLAAALPGGVRDPLFEVLLRRIDASPIHRGNAVTLYFDGTAAFAAMAEAIAAAREEVLLEAYILKDDAAGRALADALESAARRGAAVRVLADAFGSSATRGSFWRRMEERGLDVRLYHPFFPYLWYQPYRDHRKILAVDRRVAFTGGMNVGEEYGSPARGPSAGRSWRDTHARIEGAAAWEMAVVFREGWEDAGGAPFEIAPLARPPADAPAPPGASVLVLDSSPGRGHEETASVIAASLAASRERFWLTNAYFAPRRGALPLLAAAARRGVDVRLLLPGLSDVPLVRHAGHGSYRYLLRRGVRIFEYRASVLHAKSFTADGYVSMVGSTNMDFRSFHFNAECNLVALDAGVARTLEERFTADLADADEVTLAAWDRRTALHRIGDRLARAVSPVL
jgi:cardiolipin synthase A/B